MSKKAVNRKRHDILQRDICRSDGVGRCGECNESINGVNCACKSEIADDASVGLWEECNESIMRIACMKMKMRV